MLLIFIRQCVLMVCFSLNTVRIILQAGSVSAFSVIILARVVDELAASKVAFAFDFLLPFFVISDLSNRWIIRQGFDFVHIFNSFPQITCIKIGFHSNSPEMIIFTIK